jgi:hypothetical protein
MMNLIIPILRVLQLNEKFKTITEFNPELDLILLCAVT